MATAQSVFEDVAVFFRSLLKSELGKCLPFLSFIDVDVDKPDEKSIMTYVSQFFKAFPETGSHKKVRRSQPF